MVQYTFVAPTKSGTSALQQFFSSYDENIKTNQHAFLCTNDNNPIIVVRDVASRFLSMYKYWKNGSLLYTRSEEWKEKYKDFSLRNFVHYLKDKNPELYNDFTWDQHFAETFAWINGTDYKNIVVVRYETDLNDKIQALLTALEIPNKNIALEKRNVSIDESSCDAELEKEEIQLFIQEYFKNDLAFMKTINEHPEFFKMVI